MLRVIFNKIAHSRRRFFSNSSTMIGCSFSEWMSAGERFRFDLLQCLDDLESA